MGRHSKHIDNDVINHLRLGDNKLCVIYLAVVDVAVRRRSAVGVCCVRCNTVVHRRAAPADLIILTSDLAALLVDLSIQRMRGIPDSSTPFHEHCCVKF